MSYRLTKGAYYSHTTQRSYQFKQGDTTDQRRAKRQMEHEASVFQTAEQTRVANVPKDTRTVAERVQDETVHTKQRVGGDADRSDAIKRHIADLLQQLRGAHSASQKAILRKSIERLTPRVGELDAQIQATAERQAQLEAPEVQAALTEAQQQFDDWRFRDDIAADVVDGAAAALESLKSNLDVAAFKATVKELRSKHNQNKNAELMQLRAQQKELEDQFFKTLADEAPPEATPPQVGPIAMVEAAE